MTELKVGTLFSGIGAPEQALKNIRRPHRVAWACDIDKFCRQTYAANHTANAVYTDILLLAADRARLEPVDLLVAGFPCTDISVNGPQNLMAGRSNLIFPALDIIDQIKSPYVILENVPQLLSPKFSQFYKLISDRLSQHYQFTTAVYNSKDFGVAQNRERVYITAVLKGKILPPIVQPVYPPKVLADILIEDKPNIPSTGKFYTCGWQETANYRQYDRSGKGQRNQTDRVYYPNSLSPALRHGSDQYYVQLASGIRKLTTVELCRLQGFPDDFKFPVSRTQAAAQLGNSMTVPILEEIFTSIFTANRI